MELQRIRMCSERTIGLEGDGIQWLMKATDRAVKLTLQPAAMTRADVQSLRDVGFTDGDILAIAEVTGYYAYVNRIADGLGVALEEE